MSNTEIQTMIVDSNGNLYPVVEINEDIDIWQYTSSGDITAYVMSVHTDLSPSVEDYIIDAGVSPVEVYTFRDFRKIEAKFKIPLMNTGINSVTGDIRQDSLTCVFKYQSGDVNGAFTGYSGRLNNDYIYSRSYSLADKFDMYKIGLYRAFIKAPNRMALVNAIIYQEIKGDEVITNRNLVQLSAADGNWFGTTWKLIDEDDPDKTIIKEKQFDNSGVINNNEGGYGEGKMPHDEIPIPDKINITLWSTGSTLYELTNNQMKAFTQWLWTNDWTQNIRKVRNEPMENIINVSLCDFDTGGGIPDALVWVGNITSSTTATLLSSNFTQIDCGSIDVTEYYGTFADYSPYVVTTLYLPKVGFVSIPADEVMNNTIHVVYSIEMSSGEGICYVQLTNKRDGFSYIWNTYTCICTSTVSLSESSHVQQLIATSNAIINTTVATSGMIANPTTAITGLPSIGSSIAQVATTKNPTITKGNIGNMGSIMCYRKPYLMIQRVNVTKPSSFADDNGYMINYTATIGNHTGFLKTKNYHAEINAPSNVKAEIERLMNEGVFING